MPMKLMHSNCLSAAKRSGGVGLVEVLVALIVIAVGMLGIASLYVISLQAKTTAAARMQAVNLAYDMADRIRANRTAANAYLLSSAASGTVTAPSTLCGTSASTNCNSAEMAAADLYLWDQMVKGTSGTTVSGSNGLPGNVTRQITFTAATVLNPAMYTIQLNWGEPNSAGVVQSYQLEVRI